LTQKSQKSLALFGKDPVYFLLQHSGLLWYSFHTKICEQVNFSKVTGTCTQECIHTYTHAYTTNHAGSYCYNVPQNTYGFHSNDFSDYCPPREVMLCNSVDRYQTLWFHTQKTVIFKIWTVLFHTFC